MAGFFSKVLPWLTGGLASKTGQNFLFGKEGKYKDLSTLTKQQQPLHDQLVNAGLGEGAGGAFGSSADYYRDLLSDNPQDLESFYAPELRRYNEEIIPGLAEQFAGMGSGALSSSGFRNSAVNAGTDLAERLGAIRSNLRSQGAAGLANIGQIGLNPVKENIYESGQPGFLQQAAPGVANATAQYFGMPPMFGGGTNTQNTSPYRNSIGGNKVGANRNPYTNQPSSSGFNLPNFNMNTR